MGRTRGGRVGDTRRDAGSILTVTPWAAPWRALEPMADADAAWELACDAIEIVPGDWTDSGRWYVVP
jgi:hypothetical protein